MVFRVGSKAARETRTKRPADTAFKQQKLKAWRPILSPRAAIITFFASGFIFVPIGVVVAVISNSVVEVESVNYDSVCTTNPCYFNLTIPEKMEAPVFVYYKLSNFYQNHRKYVRDRSDAQLAGEAGLTPSALDCTARLAHHDVRSSELAASGWKWDSMENVISPCGLIAYSQFNDSFRIETHDGTAIPHSEHDIAWATDREKKFKNAADGSTGLNFEGFRYWRSASCDELPDPTLRQPCKDAAATAQSLSPGLPPPGWCFHGSGYCVEDEHFIIWMRTAGLSTFRKLFAILNQDLEPGTYRVMVANGVRDDNTGVYMKQDLSGPQVDLYPVSSFSGTKALVLSTKATGLGGKNPFLGIAYIVVGAACIVLALGFTAKDRLSPRKLGSAPYIVHSAQANALTQDKA